MRILSLSGGGIRGIFQAVFLRDLAREMNRPLHECFDLVAGTSTGAILALGVALNIDFEKIVTLFENEGPKIFPKRIQKKTKRMLALWVRGRFVNQMGFNEAVRLNLQAQRTRRSNEGLLNKNYYSGHHLGSIRNTLILEYRSLRRRQQSLDGTLLFATDVALASAAAPSFFKSHQPRGLDATHRDVRLRRKGPIPMVDFGQTTPFSLR